MVETCCNIVGNFFETGFNLPGAGCFISVNNTINTDFGNYGCEGLDISGQTVGSLNLSGYAGTNIYQGCSGRAGVQVLWVRKYDCENDIVYFIFAGAGRSFKYGDENDIYGNIIQEYSKTTKVISASSQSGPQTLYTDIEQTEGIGMSYNQSPITFNTNSENSCTLSNMGVGTSDYYLQNFNIEFVPGSIPVANYTFAYSVTE